MKGYLETYNRVKYFLWYFLNAISFRQTFGTFFGRLFQCYDFENFENRSAKPVYTTLRNDTDRRGQGGDSPSPPNKNALNDKNIKTKSTFSSVSFNISLYKSARV